MGERAFELHDKPDAGLWEFRDREAVHTYSAVMCWAACDRLANAAEQARPARPRRLLERPRRRPSAQPSRAEAWNAEKGRFAATFGGDELDASLLQLVDVRFVAPDDPRMRRHHRRRSRQGLRRGPYMLRYAVPDDFGEPETAFNFCTFWLHRGPAPDPAGRTRRASCSRRC